MKINFWSKKQHCNKISDKNENLTDCHNFCDEITSKQQKDDSSSRPVSLFGQLIIGMIRFYQGAISPMIGPCCRFTPTCSQYFILAIQKYGILYGTVKGIWRILRCNPFCKGGDDPP